MKCVLDHKKRNEEELYGFAKRLHNRLKDDWDCVIAISGIEGSGKSSLAIVLGDYIHQHGKIEPFQLDKNVLYNPKTLTIRDAILHTVPQYGVVVMDEAIKVLYKMGFMSKAQQFINQLYAICRKENKATILCIPRFTDLNEFFRNHRVLLWVHVVERGHAVILAKDWNPFISDAWHMRDNLKAMSKKSDFLGMGAKERIKILKKTPNYAGEFSSPQLTVHIEEAYKELAAQVKYEMDFEEYHGLAKKYRNLAKEMAGFLYLQGMTSKEIQDEFSITSSMMDRFLQEKGLRKIDKENESDNNTDEVNKEEVLKNDNERRKEGTDTDRPFSFNTSKTAIKQSRTLTR